MESRGTPFGIISHILRQGPSLALAHRDWLASKLQDHPSLPPKHWDYQACATLPGTFDVGSGDLTLVLTLAKQALIVLATLLAPIAS